MNLNTIFFGLTISCFACGQNNSIESESTFKNSQPETTRSLAKFEPPEGKVLVFAGQDLESIGGTEEYSNGYVDHFPMPYGVTLYTGIGGGDGSFTQNNDKPLRGVREVENLGNGPTGMTFLTNNSKFENSALAIGLSLVNNEKKVAAGELDENIKKLGEYFLSLGERPVFLRTGYEFDGYPWNHYDRPSWIAAYKRIKDKLDEQGVTNVAYVWQSVGFVSDPYQLDDWYPGDAYVDWCGFSFFNRWREVEMIEYARKKGKPVFIAEASATISDHTAKFDGDCKETKLGNPEQAREAWERWFLPFFKTIEENTDVIKAIHYINCDWTARPMWDENPTFRDIDARLQMSPFISEEWRKRMNSELYQNKN